MFEPLDFFCHYPGKSVSRRIGIGERGKLFDKGSHLTPKVVTWVGNRRNQAPNTNNLAPKFACETNRSNLARNLAKKNIVRSEGVMRSVRNMHCACRIIGKVAEELLIDRDTLVSLTINVGDLSRGTDIK